MRWAWLLGVALASSCALQATSSVFCGDPKCARETQAIAPTGTGGSEADATSSSTAGDGGEGATGQGGAGGSGGASPECTTEADCPGDITFCSTPRCYFGVCDLYLRTAGTLVPDESPGDCASARCDGSGNAVVEPDPADVPTHTNHLCMSGACEEGQPAFMPQPFGTPCPGNGTCDGAGNCVSH